MALTDKKRASTTQSVIRSGPRSWNGNVGAGSTGVVMLAVKMSFDPTAASVGTNVWLPANSVVHSFVHDGGATGGTNPTFDIGVSGATERYFNEVAADTAAVVLSNGTGVATENPNPIRVWAGVGASAATGGTVTGHLIYYRTDQTKNPGLNPGAS